MRKFWGISLALWSLVPGLQADEPKIDKNTVAAEVPRNEEETEWPLSGDWGGFRSELKNKGVELYAGYIGDSLSNVSGGIRRGSTYGGLLELGLDLETEKLGFWKGGIFHVSSLYPHGASLSAKHVGDLQTLSNIDAYDSFRLYEAYYEQSWLDDQFSVRLGQITADEEFANTETSLDFLNSAFGWPTFISINTVNTGPAFYVASPGIRLRYASGDHWFFQAGVWDGDTFDNAEGNPRINRSGTRIDFGRGQGAFMMGEVGYHTHTEGDASGKPGIYRLGAWGHTADFQDLYNDANGAPGVVTGGDLQMHSKNFGVYATAEQMVWREASGNEDEQGLSLFIKMGGSPPDRSLVEFAVTPGLVYQGMIPGRDNDKLGFGSAYAQLSRYLRRAEKADRDLNGTPYPAISDHETALETFYQFNITPHFTVQPDFQWIFHPGGSTAIADAFVVGVRVTMLF